MRDKLAVMKGTDMFTAKVAQRRKTVRIGGKLADQRIITDVRNLKGEPITDHLVLTIGREIPAVPITYARIVPGCNIKFEGKPQKYTRANGTQDYTLFVKRLVESKME